MHFRHLIVISLTGIVPFYYYTGFYGQNMKVYLVQVNASHSFAVIKSLKPDMDYFAVVII